MSGIITYKIENDMNDKLKKTAKVACNFWNSFLSPENAIVIRLGVFTRSDNVIAGAYQPYVGEDGTTIYGRVLFNTKYLDTFTDYEISGTIAHEIGHTLGMGFNTWWNNSFDRSTGYFRPECVGLCSELGEMRVELEGGSGTEYSHWDEDTFDKELMTGWKDKAEHVLPVTIKVMACFGHSVIMELPKITSLEKLMEEMAQLEFTRSEDIASLNLDYFKETEIFEEIYHTGGELPNS